MKTTSVTSIVVTRMESHEEPNPLVNRSENSDDLLQADVAVNRLVRSIELNDSLSLDEIRGIFTDILGSQRRYFEQQIQQLKAKVDSLNEQVKSQQQMTVENVNQNQLALPSSSSSPVTNFNESENSSMSDCSSVFFMGRFSNEQLDTEIDYEESLSNFQISDIEDDDIDPHEHKPDNSIQISDNSFKKMDDLLLPPNIKSVLKLKELKVVLIPLNKSKLDSKNLNLLSKKQSNLSPTVGPSTNSNSNKRSGVSTSRVINNAPLKINNTSSIQNKTQVKTKPSSSIKNKIQVKSLIKNLVITSKSKRDKKNILKPCPCDVCGKCFRTKWHLDVHYRIHTGEKNYKCSFSKCSKMFTQLSQLQQHERAHSNQRPYKCSKCSKTFIQKCHLDQHLLIHSNLKPYACALCDQKFRQKSGIYSHAKYCRKSILKGV